MLSFKSFAFYHIKAHLAMGFSFFAARLGRCRWAYFACSQSNKRASARLLGDLLVLDG